jgi:hypothetical protein
MSAKSCLLCGKPLSRLRVGGDGEFCSREHRNQYGLRRGLNRLAEVDKVSNLMRRRESPKQISAARLMRNSALNSRGFLQSPAYKSTAALAPFAPAFRIPDPPRLSQVVDRYVAPKAAKFKGTMAPRRPDVSRIRISGKASSLELPEPEHKVTAEVPPAPMAGLPCKVPAGFASRRDFALLRQTAIRIHSGNDPAALKTIALPGTAAFGRHLPSANVGAAPVLGKALRVSIGIGFKAPAIRRRTFATRPAMSTALTYSRSLCAVLPGTRNQTSEPRTLNLRIGRPPACLPAVQDGKRPAQFTYPGPLRPGAQRPRSNGSLQSRSSDIAWILSDPRAGNIGIHAATAGFARRNGVHLCNLTLAPTATNADPHVAFRHFIPQEPVGCPLVPFDGMTAASIITAPANGSASSDGPAPGLPQAAPAAIRLEEHFGEGWGNWEGGMTDWLVDVAGVRTGSLALFLPTLDLADYDLEFLARIDTRSLTWVVRATDLQEYMRCTITAIPGGELEFSRAVVRNGVAEPVVIAPQRIAGKPRAAMTVRTRVFGHTFEVSVDGKELDMWQEARLYCGGIGFMGAPDDRARLYWVRISSSENIGKELHTK